MGFFSSVSKLIGGGSESESSSTSKSGFSLLPSEIQNVYKNYATGLNSLFDNGAADSLYTPLAQTDYETKALASSLQGVTPTAESLQSDIAMQMNPYDNYVIDEINRQAQGDYSILKQAANEAGQMGSNRQMLGANDIDLSRLNQIGQFKQDQYNTAVDNSLNQLTNARAGDIALQFGAGDFLRGLDTQTKQAPINAYTSFGQLLGVLPTSGGSESSSSSSSDSQNGIGSSIAGIAAAFSDERLKDIYRKVGEENGYNLYEFSYKDDPEHHRYVGVIAQEVKEKNPDAVFVEDGYLKVRYDRIGVTMREVE